MDSKAIEARRQYRREYAARNRDHINSYHREWAKNNPDKIKEHQERYWLNKSASNEQK